MKKAISFILIVCIAFSFSSCISETPHSSETNTTTSNENTVCINENGVFTLNCAADLKQYKIDVANLYNYLYNIKKPLLYVSIPVKSQSYGLNDATAVNKAEMKNLIDSLFIDYLDLSHSFDTSPGDYYYKNNCLYTANGNFLIYQKIAEKIGSYYSILTDIKDKSLITDGYNLKTLSSAAPAPKEAEREDYSYYVPKGSNNLSVSYYNDRNQTSKISGIFTKSIALEIKFHTESESYDASLTGEKLMFERHYDYFTVSNAAKTNSAIILHNLDDLSIISLMSQCFGKITAIDVRNISNDNLITLLDSLDADVYISLVDENRAYHKPYYKSSETISNNALKENSSAYPFKDNNRMLQVAYKTSEINTALGYMKDLVKVLKEKGTDLFFVQTPFKVLENETVLPEGITDETNETADRFLAELDKIGVNILDLRQNLKESGMDTSDFFFKTDHHWTHRSAFWGYTQIVNALRDDWGHNVNPDGYYTNLDNFVVKDIKNCYFAHFGTYYNKLFVGLDDITLIYPKFETKYTYMNNQNGKIINRSGSFFDAILDSSTMNYNEEPVTSTRYHTYINASCPYVEITNESAPCDINLLIVKDSFSLPVIAWLSLNYKHITVYDAAQNTQFTLYQLLEKKSFDMMLMIYNPDICFVLPRQYKFK